MNNHQDEFESLIRSFNLDDDSLPPPETDGKPERPPVGGAPKKIPPQPGVPPEAPAPRTGATPGNRPPRPAAPKNPAPPPPAGGQTPKTASRPPQAEAFAHSAKGGEENRLPGGRPPAASRGGTAKEPERRRRHKFQVRIDDKKYYETSDGRRLAPSVYEEEEKEDTAINRMGRWFTALVVLAIALGASVFLAIFALASASDMFGLNKEDRTITVELPPDLSMSEIAKLLKEDGVITQPLTFQIYLSIQYDPENFIPGSYELNSNMSYDQIALKFNNGNYIKEEVTLTFIEGETLSDMAEKLEKGGVCEKEEFYDFLEAGEFPWSLSFLEQMPEGKERFRKFEGYLFPDTYTFYKGENVSTVVQKFFVNFNSRVDEEMRAQMAAQELTIDEVVTLASIVQKEAGKVEDMKMVSSVFRNRLGDPEQFPKLQSDVTKNYVNNYIKPFLSTPDQALYDSYNTYVCDGLPEGPICNPGLDAIKAVLEPEDTNYYYFVTDKDGKYYYAQTLAEHDANVAVALSTGDVHGVDTPEDSSSAAEGEAAGGGGTENGGT